MEGLSVIVVIVGIVALVIWFAQHIPSVRKPTPSSPPPPTSPAITQAELDNVRRQRDEYRQKGVDAQKQCAALQAENESLEREVRLARAIRPIIEPPEWISDFLAAIQFGTWGNIDEATLTYARDWAMEAADTWKALGTLSAGSKRNIEETCFAIIHSDLDAKDKDSQGPLLSKTVNVVRQKPAWIQINLFDLQAADFQRLALWLNIVLSAGLYEYVSLYNVARQLRDRDI